MATYPNNAYTGRQVQNLPGTTYEPSKLTTVFAEDINNANEEIHALGADLIDNIKPTISQHGGQISALDDQIDTVDNRITTTIEPRIGALEARTIYGTGFPNGVVTAPVGSIYIDTNTTNGASSWIKKSGTGNTGWKVLEGDTGWRNITAIATPWAAVNPNDYGVAIRRVGSTVDIAIKAQLVNSGLPPMWIIPLGFKFGVGGLPSGVMNLWQTAGSGQGQAQLFSSFQQVTLSPNSAGTRYYGSITGSTTNDWPTTLPGTAV